MAKRSRQSFLKRQRERKRAEKAALKRLKRQQRRRGEVDEVEGEIDPAQDATAGEPGTEPAPDDSTATPEREDDAAPAVVGTNPGRQD